MKKIVLLIGFILSLNALLAQEEHLDSDSIKFIYQEVIQLDSIDREILYQNAMNWFEERYKTQNLEVVNKQEGRLSHHGKITISTQNQFRVTKNHEVSYTITILVKKGRYKYAITNFEIDNVLVAFGESMSLKDYYYNESPLLPMSHEKTKKEVINKVEAEVTSMIKQLNQVMKGVEEEW